MVSRFYVLVFVFLLVKCNKAVPVCPAGWVLGGQSCYFFSTDSKNWNDARTDCTNKGGDMLEISSAAENDLVKSKMPSSADNYWMGLTDENNEGTFVWISTNAVATDTDWNTGEPSNNYGDEDCAHYWWKGMSVSQKWNDYPCDTTQLYICEKGTVAFCTPQNPCQNGGVCNEDSNSCKCASGYTGATCNVPVCPAGWVLGGQSCYFFGTDSKNWNDARTDCTNKGGDMLEISSAEENDLVKSKMPSSTDNYWMGLTDENNEGTFVWISTNAVATYTDWNTGEPNNNYGDEDCAHYWWKGMSVSQKWNDYPCDTTQLYICEKGTVGA